MKFEIDCLECLYCSRLLLIIVWQDKRGNYKIGVNQKIISISGVLW